jgi:hypothetical protein
MRRLVKAWIGACASLRGNDILESIRARHALSSSRFFSALRRRPVLRGGADERVKSFYPPLAHCLRQAA